MMRIREILNLKGGTIYSIAPAGLLTDAVSLMVKHDVGSLVVLSDGAMVGMVTFREVLAALDAAGGSLGRRTVEEVMVKDPPCGKPDDTIDHMRSLMTELHVRYLPIMDDGRLTRRSVVSRRCQSRPEGGQLREPPAQAVHQELARARPGRWGRGQPVGHRPLRIRFDELSSPRRRTRKRGSRSAPGSLDPPAPALDSIEGRNGKRSLESLQSTIKTVRPSAEKGVRRCQLRIPP